MRLIAFMLLMLLSQGACGQKSKLWHIQQWVTWCDSSIQFNDDSDLYIIDGILHSAEKAEPVLEEFGKLVHLGIDFLTSKDIENTIFHRPGRIIILVSDLSGKMKRKNIKSSLKRIRSEFRKNKIQVTDRINEQPVLSINDSVVWHYDSWKVINSLKVRDIRHIHYSQKAPDLIYGELAKNGLVRVWLKP